MEKEVIRTGQKIEVVPINSDLKQLFGNNGQLLLSIKKNKSILLRLYSLIDKYYLEVPPQECNEDLIPKYQSEAEFAGDGSHQTLPVDTKERIYAVVRTL